MRPALLADRDGVARLETDPSTELECALRYAARDDELVVEGGEVEPRLSRRREISTTLMCVGTVGELGC